MNPLERAAFGQSASTPSLGFSAKTSASVSAKKSSVKERKAKSPKTAPAKTKSGKAKTPAKGAGKASDASKAKASPTEVAEAKPAAALKADKKSDKKAKIKQAREKRRTRRAAARPGDYTPPASSINLPAPVQTALSAMMGTPYRMGGESQRGTDCSGFVRQVLSPAGCDLPRTSSEQAQMGRRVSAEDLKPGDLVFFSTRGRGRISHVGLYLGQDKMAHASPGKGVVISSLLEPYYQNRFVTARRILSPAPQ